jgi:hypothetical protein
MHKLNKKLLLEILDKVFTLYIITRYTPKGIHMIMFNAKVVISIVRTGMKLIKLYQGTWFAYIPVLTSIGKMVKVITDKIYTAKLINDVY